MFPSKTLEKYHARLIKLRKDQVLFHHGDNALDYYQVETGSIKMFIASPDGQEFIQGIFASGESFGEPALRTPGVRKRLKRRKFGSFPVIISSKCCGIISICT